MSNHRIFLIVAFTLSLILSELTIQVLGKGQLVQDCNSTPSLENVNEVRKFVDNCIKTKDGIRFRKRHPDMDGKSKWNNNEIPTSSVWLTTQPLTAKTLNNQNYNQLRHQSIYLDETILLKYLMEIQSKAMLLDQILNQQQQQQQQ